MSLAFVFPGQASQSIGMMSALAQVSPGVQATFAEASAVLGYDLWQRCQEGPAELLNSTECTQPAMLTAGVATYRLWREPKRLWKRYAITNPIAAFTLLTRTMSYRS